MSITTTSASCLSAMPRATVAPTLPAPPTTVTLRFISSPRHDNAKAPKRAKKNDLCPLCARCVRPPSHVLNDVVAELGCLQFGRAVHQACEVVGDTLRPDGAFDALDNQVRHFVPAEMPEHHLAGQNH